MNDRTVTELVIDADTSGAAAYEQAMASAERAARGGVDASNSYVTAIVGVGTAAAAAALAVKAAMDQIAGWNKQLADMALNAKQVGLSLADLQGVEFGARKEGLTDQQIAAGLQKSAELLNDAQRNANSLSKEFEANGLSIRRANGQLITQNQLLQVAADLVKRAQTPQDQIAIAQMLGFTKEWVPFLEQGAGAMRGLTEEARKAGAVIDDETIKKAAEFDREWRKSSVELEFQLKAALVGLLPYVNDLITRLTTFVATIDRAKVVAAAEAHADAALQKAVDAGVPKSGGLKIDVSAEQIMADWNDGNKSFLERLDSIVTRLVNGTQFLSAEDVERSYSPYPEVQDPMSSSAYPARGPKSIEEVVKKLREEAEAARLAAQGHSIVASKRDEASDAVDRAIATIGRHIEVQRADAAALGLGDAALARFRVEAQQTAAIQANGGRISAEQVKAFERLKLEAYDTADAFARLKVEAQIDFAQNTRFLSPQDVAIAQQLRGIYGNDVPRALASTEAAQLRVINATREMSDGFREVGKSIFTAFLTGKSGMDAMIASLDGLSNKLAGSAFDNLVSGALTANPAQMGIGALQAGAAALITVFTGDLKAQQALEEAQRRWAGMTRQVEEFNQAAAGVDIQPLTQELNSLYQQAHDLVEAAAAAKDPAGVQRILATFQGSVDRIVGEFASGGDISPLQKAIQDVKAEAAGLTSLLEQMGAPAGSIAVVTEALPRRIAEVIASYREGIVSGLEQRLNAAEGKDYLNDAARLIEQNRKDIAAAAELGNDPAMLAQISAVFAAEAQKIVQDAGLVGEEFAGFMELFPDLAGVVHRATVDITGSIDTIRKYLESLDLGDNSILSPQQQLDLAKSNFERQFALAQGGDAEALGSITQYAQTLLDQARAFYASSAGYADVFRTVTAALGGLGGTGIGAQSPADLSTLQASSLPGAVPHVMAPAVASPANDNGAQLAAQTQSLAQTMIQTSQAQIVALQSGVDVLAGKLDRLVAAAESSRGKALRPLQKAVGDMHR